MKDRIILSLFDYTGHWSEPYRKAGYTVWQRDIKLGADIFEDMQEAMYDRSEGLKVHGVMAAVPCTDFALSGARWWQRKENEPSPENTWTNFENLDALRTPTRVYASYHIITNFGVQKKTGATWLDTDAWQKVTNDPQADGTRFINDLIAKLDADGELDDIDLNKRGNYLVVLWPGAPPRKGWALDSRELPGEATE